MPSNYQREAKAIADLFMAKLMNYEKKEVLLLAKQWETIQNELLVLITKIAEKELKSPDQLYRLGLYQRLLDQSEKQIKEYSTIASGVVSTGQKHFALTAIESTEKTLQLKTRFFDRLDPKVINQFIGRSFYSGNKLDTTLFANSYPATMDAVKSRLLQGIALGRGPRETASLIKKESNAPLWQSLRLARTEQLNIYRETSVKSMQESGLPIKKQRVEESDACDECQEVNGKIYDLDDEGDDFHPNCRGCYVAYFED